MEDTLFEAVPDDEIRSKIYYHGTYGKGDGLGAAVSIARNGLQPPDIASQKEHALKPVVGKTYITPHIDYAQIYAIGGDVAGSSYKPKHTHGYVFAVHGKKLVDVQPDEDSVGELFYKKDSLATSLSRHATPATIRDAKDGEYSAWAKFGKQVLRRAGDSDKLALLKRDAAKVHVAHGGSLQPDRVYRISMDKIPVLAKDGSNFFDHAEELDMESLKQGVEKVKRKRKPMHLTEEIHPDIHATLNNPSLPSHAKHREMAKLFRTMVKHGQEPGLIDKPKKGSSRAVYFPKDEDDITIDGKPTKMKSFLKVAYPGSLDKKYGSKLLGELQNYVEANPSLQNDYAVLKHDGKGGYTTNPNGILAPVLHAHEDGHYLHMAHARPLETGEFRKLTTTDEFPRGIGQKDFADYIGKINRGEDVDDHPIHEHPFAQAVHQMHFWHGINPADFQPRNLGVWKHPHTGKEQLVAVDYGYDSTVNDAYNHARKEKYKIHW